jgi:predicted phosphodiesterase
VGVRCLVLSDIHSNLAAFEVVLADAGFVDQVWCAGDVIGYGPQPNECLDRLRSLPHVCVAGNHDWAAIGKLDISAFNPDAMRACLWTGKQLTPDNWSYVANLPERWVQEPFTIVHGSPRYPIWEYITDPWTARENLGDFHTTYCFFGHTHVPKVYRCFEARGACIEEPLPLPKPLSLDQDRCLINPGGVGQPRDGDARASYMILDLDKSTIELRRVVYNIRQTQDLMYSLGLPHRLADRLSIGW